MTKWAKLNKQRGIASIIVVFIITILISLVSLGFARLMDRTLKNVTNNQLGAAAEYAAQSGLNDAIAFAKQNQDVTVSSCKDVSDTTTALGKYISTQKGGANLGGLTSYSCVLINPLPGNLAFQNLQPYQSQVVKLNSNGGAFGSLLFSWQSANGQPNNTSSLGQFPDEATWNGDKNAPVIRITLYRVVSPNVPTNASSRTFYLYPTSGGSNSIDFAASQSGSVIGGNCGAAAGGGYTSSYACNTIITNLASTGANYYEARITPLYTAADVGIQGEDAAGGKLTFKDAQTIIDVTGKSDAAVKRIQARVALGDQSDVNSGTNGIPEDAIRSADTICKRLIVPSVGSPLDGHVYVDPGSTAPECGNSVAPLTPIQIHLNAIPTSVNVGDTTQLTWGVDSGIVTNCIASNNRGVGNWNGAVPIGGSRTSDTLNTPPDVTFTLTCSNPSGQSDTVNATVTVTQPVPVVTLKANPVAVTVGKSSTLTWTATNNPTQCIASNDSGLGSWSGTNINNPLSGGSISTGSLSSAKTYNFYLVCSNAGGSSTQAQASVTATSNPITPPPPSPSCANQTGGNGSSNPPNACVRSVVVGWYSGSPTLYVNAYVDHCYSGITINYPGGGNQSYGWPGGGPPGGDNIYITKTYPGDGPAASTSGGSVTVYCYGNGQSYLTVSLSPYSSGVPTCPSPPGSGPCAPPPCPSPPGSGPCAVPPCPSPPGSGPCGPVFLYQGLEDSGTRDRNGCELWQTYNYYDIPPYGSFTNSGPNGPYDTKSAVGGGIPLC